MSHIVTEQSDNLLRVHPEKRGDAIVVHVAGELDLATAPTLDRLLIESETALRLVLDLTGVTFMASAGLALLMKHEERSRAAGREMRVVATGSAVLRPIDLTGIAAVVTVVNTLADALADD